MGNLVLAYSILARSTLTLNIAGASGGEGCRSLDDIAIGAHHAAPSYVVVVVTPSDKFAYVVNNLTGSDGAFGVFQFTVDSTTGVLTPNNPAFVASGNGPTEIAVDPTSKFAYVVNRQDNTLSMYTVDPGTGNLTLNTARANPTGTIATGDEPFRARFDPSGKFLYVANENNPASIYTVNNDGTLNAVGSTASNSLAIAFAVPK